MTPPSLAAVNKKQHPTPNISQIQRPSPKNTNDKTQQMNEHLPFVSIPTTSQHIRETSKTDILSTFSTHPTYRKIQKAQASIATFNTAWTTATRLDPMGRWKQETSRERVWTPWSVPASATGKDEDTPISKKRKREAREK